MNFLPLFINAVPKKKPLPQNLRKYLGKRDILQQVNLALVLTANACSVTVKQGNRHQCHRRSRSPLCLLHRECVARIKIEVRLAQIRETAFSMPSMVLHMTLWSVYK